MRKIILSLVCLMMINGCAPIEDIDNWVFGDFRANRQRVEEQHQRLMELYDLQAKMIEAKLAGDTNITDADLTAINTSINEIKAQQQQQKTQQTLQGIEDELKQINTYNRYGY